jgi:hypothetical protein
VVRARPAGARPPDLDLSVFGSETSIATVHIRHEHVTLSTGVDRIGFEVRAGTLLAGPVALELAMPRLCDHRAVFSSVQILNASMRTGRIVRHPFLLAASAPRWSASLQAWDARVMGASQREIGILLYGADRVRCDWYDGADSLRSQVRRLLDHADRMIFGGWRDLLSGRRRSSPSGIADPMNDEASR